MFPKKMRMILSMAAGILSLIPAAYPESTTALQGQGQIIVTVLPQKDGESSLSLLHQDLQLKVNRKISTITEWQPFREGASNLEMVLLINGSADAGLGLQFGEIGGFIRSLPPDVKLAVGYSSSGGTILASPFSTSREEAVRELRIPGEDHGSSANPFLCLSDLAKHWPSTDLAARREVIVISDGLATEYYVKTVIEDVVRAGLVVYSIFWPGRGATGKPDLNSFVSQSLLGQITRATGGCSYGTGSDQPVSFRPYFNDITRRLRNQYRLRFRSRLKDKPQVQSVELKVGNAEIKISAPRRVFITKSSGN